MSDYTPETDEVRHLYARAMQTELGSRYADANIEFDNWLNAKLAEAWDEGFIAPRYRSNLNGDYLGKTKNPYRPEATS